MDESWRKLMGTGRSPPAALDPEDFSDVFGGPPQTVLLRKFSGDRTPNSSQSFYGLMSRPQGVSPTSRLSAGVRIPDVCYKDVFIGGRKSRDRSGQGSNGLSKSKSKSKSNSSSVLSSEELSPLRPIIGDDAGLSYFGLKSRPINVPCRWNSTADFPSEHQKMQGTSPLPCGSPCAAEGRLMENHHEYSIFKKPQSGLSRRAPSPEPFTAEPNSDRGVKTPAEEEEEEVKAALLSSLTSGDRDRAMEERGMLAMSDEDDELSSSYVIEITPGIRDGADKTPRVDEAIEWDKGSFTPDNVKNDSKESWSRTGSWKEHILPEVKEMRKLSDQAAGILSSKSKSAQMIEFEALDRNMKLWTSGTEKDIRQLLSTLHQIMWLNSGWDAISLTSLRKSSQVKKAYQKARQCLQPDRLQQRGATSLQKYIAHKALTIIQDSWTKYISEGNSR